MKYLLLIFSILIANIAIAQLKESVKDQYEFIHPGLLHNQADLDFIKQKVKAKEEPWFSGWKTLLETEISNMEWQSKATANVLRGSYNKPDIGASKLERDAAAVYSQAIQWIVTEEPRHAQKAIAILNNWSSTLKSIGEHDAKLLVGMTGVSMINGAEIIRHTCDLWQEDDIAQFEKMLLEVHYYVIKDFFDWANGNWDASMIQTMLSIGVFLDNDAIFQRAVEYFLEGKGNGAILNYFNYFGQCQESGRDQSHVQMGIGFLGAACEIAWKQGVDLYGAYNHRLAQGFEYTAKYNLGYDVPFEPYSSIDGRYNHKTISGRGRGRFRPIYERAYHHYHDRMGMEMPYTREVIEKNRPEGWHIQHTGWGTLLHAGLPVFKKSRVDVSNLAELREAVQNSGQSIVMKPGRYNVTDLPEGKHNFPCSGSNNNIDLTGVYINFPVGTSDGAHFFITGSNNTIRGGSFEDTYQNGMTEVTDFSGYNHNRTTLARGLKGGGNIRISGNNNTIIAIKMTTRGSFPYGYGNTYGIGRDNVAGLDKRCAMLITGVGNTIDGCEFQHRAFGHVIYMQGKADKTLIKNTYIEGAVRPSNDLYKESREYDLPKRFNYQLPIGDVKGLPIPRDVMLNLTEDGIRAYRIPGSVTVENCVIKKTRGGIKLYMAQGDVVVRKCTVLDAVIEGYSLPSGGRIINCRGNAAYGPLIYMHFNSMSNQEIELEILSSPHAVGNHVFAAIRGTGHKIKLTQAGSPVDATLRPIVVGYNARFQFLTTDYPGVPGGYETNYEKYFGDKSYNASNITIDNGTDYPVILGELSEKNSVISVGTIKDLGENNSISNVRIRPVY